MSFSDSECPIPRLREPRTRKKTVSELIDLILDGEGEFLGYRNTLLAENNREPLKDVLTRIIR